jgi:hypothetical protein
MLKGRRIFRGVSRSFVNGFGRAIDIRSTMGVRILFANPDKADFDSIKEDWEYISEDFKVAIENEKKRNPALAKIEQ